VFAPNYDQELIARGAADQFLCELKGQYVVAQFTAEGEVSIEASA